MAKNKTFYTTLSTFVVIGLTLWGIASFFPKSQALAAEEQQTKPKATPVTVAKPVVKDVQNYYEFTGATKASESVEIRARVKGYLQTVNFTDGSDIKKGDLLFGIEQDSFKAACDKAKAQLLSCKADLERAQLDLERVEKAAQSNAVSKQEVSTKRAQRDMCKAAVLAAQAALKDADLQLSYTTINSPISGRISRSLVDAGNLVGSGENTLLTTVLNLDPINAYFTVSEDILVKEIKQRKLHGYTDSSIKCFVALNGDDEYSNEGFIDYIDNTVDVSTGTIKLRAKLKNTEKSILPGMFVRIKVPATLMKNAVLINERAICTDLNNKYILVVDKDNVVQRRNVKLGTIDSGLRVITNGLSADDTYILKGIQFVRPGMPVTPIPEQAEQNKLAKAENNTKQETTVD